MVLANKAESPNAVLLVPEVLEKRDLKPIAEFDLPILFENKAFDPRAVFLDPDEFEYKALSPIPTRFEEVVLE